MNYYYHFPITSEELKSLTIRQLYKEYRCTVELLHEMKAMKEKGSLYHLGDPIYKKIYDYSRDLKVLTKYLTSIGRDITKIKTNIPKAEPVKAAAPDPDPLEIIMPLASDRFTPLITFIRFKRQYTIYKYYCNIQQYDRYLIRDNKSGKSLHITVSLTRFVVNKYNPSPCVQ